MLGKIASLALFPLGLDVLFGRILIQFVFVERKVDELIADPLVAGEVVLEDRFAGGFHPGTHDLTQFGDCEHFTHDLVEILERHAKGLKLLFLKI